MKYKYYKYPNFKSVIYRTETKRRIADERWELYVGRGKWIFIEGLSAECEPGLMYGAWNDMFVMEISEQEAQYIITNYESLKQRDEIGE